MRPLRRLDPILIQAVIAAALSFAHIHDIAEAAGQGGWKAWAYPVSVDLLMVMAWKRIRTPDVTHGGAWVWFVTSLTASLGANVATAGVLNMAHLPVALRVLVAGWPAIAFLGGSLLVHSAVSTPKADETEPVAEAPHTAPTVTEPAPADEPAPPQVLRSYRETAGILGCAPETVRGAANGGRLSKHYAAEDAARRYPLVDVAEASSVIRVARAAGV